MGSAIVHSTEIVTLIGAGRVNQADLAESLARSGPVVAADGGVKKALAHHVIPDAIIGDLDSIDDQDRAKVPPERFHHIPEQDSTDFDKALRNISAPLVLAVGFTGQRLDHELAAYNVLVRHSDQPLIILGEDDICFHLSAKLTLHLPAGSRLSLFPMAPVRCGTTGLRWATDGLEFRPDGRIGTSNEVTDGAVTLAPEGPGLLVILPRAALDSAITALLG